MGARLIRTLIYTFPHLQDLFFFFFFLRTYFNLNLLKNPQQKPTKMSQHPTEGLLFSTLSLQGPGSYQNGHFVLAVLVLSLIIALPLKTQLKSNLPSYGLSHWFPSTPKRPEIVYSKWFKDYQPWKHPQPVAEDFKLSESIEPKFRPFKWGPDYQVTSECICLCLLRLRRPFYLFKALITFQCPRPFLCSSVSCLLFSSSGN